MFLVSASGHAELQSRDRSIVVTALSFEARSPSCAGSGFDVSLRSCALACPLVPRAVVLAPPLQHLEVAALCRFRARPVVPRAAVHAHPLQHLEVAVLCRERARLPVPRELLRAHCLQLLEISASRHCRTRETLVLQNTARVPFLQQTRVSEVHGFPIQQLLDLVPRRIHGVAHNFAHRAESTEIRGLQQELRTEDVRGDHVEGKDRDVLSRGGGIHASNRGHHGRKSTRRVCVVRSCAVSLLPRSAGDLAKGRFFLGRYIRVAFGLFVLVTKRFSPRHPLLFEATMPRRYARSDVHDSDTTSVDIQNHYPAPKPRVSRSASLIRRVTLCGRGSGVFRDREFFANTVFRDGSPRTVGGGCNRPKPILRATTPVWDGDAKHTRRSQHARRPKDALRHVRMPFRAETARLEVGVARSARNAARFVDRDRRHRLFGFFDTGSRLFLVPRAARFASAGQGAKSAFDLIPDPDVFPVLWGHGQTSWTPRVVDGDTRAALETERFAYRGSCSDFSVFRRRPRVLPFHHLAIPAASRPSRLTRAAFPMRVTVEGHASTLDLAVPRSNLRVYSSACADLCDNASRWRCRRAEKCKI